MLDCRCEFVYIVLVISTKYGEAETDKFTTIV